MSVPRGGLPLIVRGGTLLPMDGSRETLRGDLLVEDGKLTQVGGRAKPRGLARVLDARGCLVLPGFVQAHVHLCQTLFRGMAEDRPLLAWLKEKIFPYEAAHDPRSLRASAELGLAELIRGGVTTLLDMGTVHHYGAVFEAMRRAGVRGIGGKCMVDIRGSAPRPLVESTKKSLASSDALADRYHGAADGRLRYAYCPRFILTCSERLLRGVAERSEARGATMHTHVAEQKAERRAVLASLGVSDLEGLRRAGIRGERAVLAHGVHLGAAERKKVAKDGSRIAHCPTANLKLASGIAPVGALRRAGVLVGLGADGAPCNNRMSALREMALASLVAKVEEKSAEALGAMDALAMATIEGARALGVDAETGSLTVGKDADVVVVSIEGVGQIPGGSPAERLVHASGTHHVRHVLARGRVLLEDGELRTLDEEEVRRRARREAKRLLERAG